MAIAAVGPLLGGGEPVGSRRSTDTGADRVLTLACRCCPKPNPPPMRWRGSSPLHEHVLAVAGYSAALWHWTAARSRPRSSCFSLCPLRRPRPEPIIRPAVRRCRVGAQCQNVLANLASFSILR
jgi:hypothetical protein